MTAEPRIIRESLTLVWALCVAYRHSMGQRGAQEKVTLGILGRERYYYSGVMPANKKCVTTWLTTCNLARHSPSRISCADYYRLYFPMLRSKRYGKGNIGILHARHIDLLFTISGTLGQILKRFRISSFTSRTSHRSLHALLSVICFGMCLLLTFITWCSVPKWGITYSGNATCLFLATYIRNTLSSELSQSRFWETIEDSCS